MQYTCDLVSVQIVEKPVGPVNLSTNGGFGGLHQIYNIVKTAQFCPKAKEISPKPRKIRFLAICCGCINQVSSQF